VLCTQFLEASTIAASPAAYGIRKPSKKSFGGIKVFKLASSGPGNPVGTGIVTAPVAAHSTALAMTV
jgi:hypothetical protein